jgi:hypothetical protein
MIPRKNTHDKENGFMHSFLALKIIINIFGHCDLVESNLQGIMLLKIVSYRMESNKEKK